MATEINTSGGGDGGCSERRAPCLTEYGVLGNVESYRYYLARRTVLEMLRDRGYKVDTSELTLSLAGFQAAFGEKPNLHRLRIHASHGSDPQKKVMVVFMGRDEIQKQDITELLGEVFAEKENVHGLIMVMQSKINRFAKELEKAPYKVEFFHMDDLLVNVTKHVLQPKMEILSANRKEWLLKKCVAQDKQLPRMLQTDAVAKYHGLEKGQVVKITYDSGDIENLVTYRCVM